MAQVPSWPYSLTSWATPVILSAKELSQPPFTTPTASSLVVVEGPESLQFPTNLFRIIWPLGIPFFSRSDGLDNWWRSAPPHRDASKLQSSQTFYLCFRPFLRIYTLLCWCHPIHQPKGKLLGWHMHPTPMYLIKQLLKDLKGLQWFQIWPELPWMAAAKGICKWGEINLSWSFNGHCLST